MKTERTQIHFLSDVLVAVASLDLKVPKIVRVNDLFQFCAVAVDNILGSFSCWHEALVPG